MSNKTIETWSLPCALSDDELRARGEELGKLVDQRVAKEAEKKETTKMLKEEVDALGEKIVRMATIVRTKEEERPVEVVERPNLAKRMIEHYRLDLHELVSSRPMTPSEVVEFEQKVLPFESLRGGAAAEA